MSNARSQKLLEELSALKSRINEIETELKGGEPTTSSARPALERGASISHPVNELATDLPNEKELSGLQQIVLQRMPKIAPDPSRDEEFSRDFRRAFAAISSLDRAEKPNKQYYLGTWIDLIAPICGGQVRGNAFIAAAIAQGDVAWTEADDSQGIVWEFGFLRYAGGRPAIAGAWRKVLAGEIVPPMPPDRPFKSGRPVDIRLHG